MNEKREVLYRYRQKRNQVETLKNKVSEMRNSLDGLSGKMEMTKKQVRKPEYRSTQTAQSEEGRKKRFKNIVGLYKRVQDYSCPLKNKKTTCRLISLMKINTKILNKTLAN